MIVILLIEDFIKIFENIKGVNKKRKNELIDIVKEIFNIQEDHRRALKSHFELWENGRKKEIPNTSLIYQNETKGKDYNKMISTTTKDILDNLIYNKFKNCDFFYAYVKSSISHSDKKNRILILWIIKKEKNNIKFAYFLPILIMKKH